MIGKKQIPQGTQWLMLGTAIFFDLVQLILVILPIIGWIISRLMTIIIVFIFFIWFKLYGMSFTKPKRLATVGIGASVEAIFSELPGWTFTVFMLIKGQEIIKAASGVAPVGGKIVSYASKAR